jgi:GNAT superfamily N-acetyltransferase
MVSVDVLLAADANMRATWRTITSCCPSPSAVEREGVLLLGSGVPVGLFNPALVSAPPSDAAALVAEVVEHYAGLGAPFVLYFRDAYANGLAEAAAAAGLVEHYRPPLMLLDPIVPAPAPPTGLEIVEVDASNLDDCRAVLAEGFGMPLDLVRPAFPPTLLEVEPMTSFLALVDGVAAGTAATFVTDDIAGIYNVATVPAQRGKGVGAAVTWAAVQAGGRAGATRSILQASGAGAPVYERMGFTTPDRYRQFEPGS